jgi:hypothetical protein
MATAGADHEPTARERWDAEHKFRERELAIKEAEIKARQADADRSWFANPIFVAIGAALMAALGNALVAYLNGASTRDLEERKAEQVRILEMIKTTDTEKAAANLRFLVDAGLITDERRRAELRAYLDRRPKGTGPVLPATATAAPVQASLEQLELRIFVCEGSAADNRTQAEAFRQARPQSSTQRWRRDYLSVADNALQQYRLTRNEVRYNPEEEQAADQLVQLLRESLGVEAAKVLTLFPSPNSVSVFFCNGASPLPLPAGGQAPATATPAS